MPERQVRELSLLDPLHGGDHVAWITHDPGEFEWMASKQLSQSGSAGDKLFLVASGHRSQGAPLMADDVTVFDPVQTFQQGGPLPTEVLLSAVQEQDERARGEGFRGLRVVADMDWLLDVPADFAQVVDFEQRLDRLAADTGALIICVYRPESFVEVELAELMSVHPHSRQPRPKPGALRIWSAGGGRWRVSGDVDMRSTEAFAARLASAAKTSGHVTLDMRTVRFIDLAGLRAIAHCSIEYEAEIVVEGLNSAMRRCWDLLDLRSSAPDVEVRV